jgi:uncharacterized protein YndB with AHSA1/START domain
MGTRTYRIETDISAPAERVWATIVDVERWPEWTASITTATRLDSGPFTVGSRTKVKQPGFPAAEWTVESIEPGVQFTWTAPAPGLHSRAVHRLSPGSDGTVHVALSVEQTGPLAGLMKLLFAKKNMTFLGLEAAGLAKRCTSAAEP